MGRENLNLALSTLHGKFLASDTAGCLDAFFLRYVALEMSPFQHFLFQKKEVEVLHLRMRWGVPAADVTCGETPLRAGDKT